MKKVIVNKAGSIKAKLLNLARAQRIDFDALFLRYLQERFLYRLSNSPFASHFILKGGLLLIYLNVPQTRATKDIDFLGVGVKNTPTEMKRIFARIAGVEYADGVRFDVHSITLEEIKPESEYVGIRLKIDAYLGKARKRMQLDIGFGDVVWPKAKLMNLPALLPKSEPRIDPHTNTGRAFISTRLRRQKRLLSSSQTGSFGVGVKVYSIESIISEKFEAMVKLSLANSRMKDFYDVYILSANHNFDSGNLGQAVKKTFKRRATQLDNKSLIFRPQFRNDKGRQKQWLAFLRKSRLDNAPNDFRKVMKRITVFLKPMTIAIINDTETGKMWNMKTGRWKIGVSRK